jgi:hypothetical protein
MDDYEGRVSRLRRHQSVDVATLAQRVEQRCRLVPGLRRASIPLNPVGNSHCPACGAHFPSAQEFCTASDCDEVQIVRANLRAQKA